MSTCRGVDTDYAYVFSPHSVVYMVAQIHARTPIKCVHTWASRCVVRLCVPVFYACVFVLCVCVCACMRVHMREAAAAASPVCVRRVCLPVSQVCNVRACACIWCTQLCRLLYTQTTEKTELMYPLLFPEIELELFAFLPFSLFLSVAHSPFGSKLNHPNIVGFRGFTTTSEGVDTLALEMCSTSLGSILEERHDEDLGPLPAKNTFKMIMDIAQALDFLHTEARLLHGDLKSFNVLVKGEFEICKLCDFGVTMPLDENGEINFHKNPQLQYVGKSAHASVPENHIIL